MQEELVSVIIPVYNCEGYIDKTVASVLNQSYKNIEIIIVDDCSTDSSASRIKRLAEKDNRLTPIFLKKNSGVAVARNTAIKMARGRYVAFLDSDDLWYKNKLKKQISFMQNGKIGFSYTAIEMIDENDKIIKLKRPVKDIVDYDFLLKNTIIPTSSVVIDLNKFGKFEMPQLRSFQDYATWLMLLRNGSKAYGIDETLVQYRRRSGSLSSNKLKNFKKVWRIQVKNEGLNPFVASINCLSYMFYGVKKYFF